MNQFSCARTSWHHPLVGLAQRVDCFMRGPLGRANCGQFAPMGPIFASQIGHRKARLQLWEPTTATTERKQTRQMEKSVNITLQPNPTTNKQTRHPMGYDRNATRLWPAAAARISPIQRDPQWRLRLCNETALANKCQRDILLSHFYSSYLLA